MGQGLKLSELDRKTRGVIQKHSRPTLIIVDDFESESNAPTPERRVANKKWITEAVIPCLTPDGRLVMVGTVISDDCFLMWAKEASSWITLEYTIVDEHFGEPTWQDRFPKEKIEQIRKEFEEFGNLGGFYQEYMNQPQVPEDVRLKNNGFKYHDFDVVRINNLNYLQNINADDRILTPCYLTAVLT